MLLLLVREKPDHGYDLLERLAALGVTGVDAGHLYRVLNGFERDGLLESRWVTSSAGPQRRRYELTARGLAELDAWARRLTQLQCGIDGWLERWSSLAHVAGPNGAGHDGATHPAPTRSVPGPDGEGRLTWLPR